MRGGGGAGGWGRGGGGGGESGGGGRCLDQRLGAQLAPGRVGGGEASPPSDLQLPGGADARQREAGSRPAPEPALLTRAGPLEKSQRIVIWSPHHQARDDRPAQ